MNDTTPNRTGKNATQILSDYDSVTHYRTGADKIIQRIDGVDAYYTKKAGRKEVPVMDRLLDKTDIVPHPDFDLPCKLFDGLAYTDCYRQIWYHGKYVRVHRLALILEGETLTPNMQVDHICERKNCWETSHLEETTPGENTRRYHKNRG